MLLVTQRATAALHRALSIVLKLQLTRAAVVAIVEVCRCEHSLSAIRQNTAASWAESAPRGDVLLRLHAYGERGEGESPGTQSQHKGLAFYLEVPGDAGQPGAHMYIQHTTIFRRARVQCAIERHNGNPSSCHNWCAATHFAMIHTVGMAIPGLSA